MKMSLFLEQKKKPDEFVHGGLIQFERIPWTGRGYLTAPYIWFWIFAEISFNSEKPMLQDWSFTDYKEQSVLLNPIKSLDTKPGQSFEKFVAFVRCIKSAVIEEN